MLSPIGQSLEEQNYAHSALGHSRHHHKHSNLWRKHHMRETDESTPKILTKHVSITSYEHQTVVLPCVIEHLPADMHVIWQFGKRELSTDQVLLTIGHTQIENNYRVRVISNSSSVAKTAPITSNNLEIRKLQLSDSGWYECQLPTKPTQKNYVHLEVLSYPKIEARKLGDSLELKCQIRNMPSKYEMQWWFNEKKVDEKRHTILYHRAQNVSTSTLKLANVESAEKGVYKCKYDRIEAKYVLDFKSERIIFLRKRSHWVFFTENKIINLFSIVKNKTKCD